MKCTECEYRDRCWKRVDTQDGFSVCDGSGKDRKIGMAEFSSWLLDSIYFDLKYRTETVNIDTVFDRTKACLPDEIEAIRREWEKYPECGSYHRHVIKRLFGEMGELVCDRLGIGIMKEQGLPAPAQNDQTGRVAVKVSTYTPDEGGAI